MRADRLRANGGFIRHTAFQARKVGPSFLVFLLLDRLARNESFSCGMEWEKQWID